jgi:hypothetical protein
MVVRSGEECTFACLHTNKSTSPQVVCEGHSAPKQWLRHGSLMFKTLCYFHIKCGFTLSHILGGTVCMSSLQDLRVRTLTQSARWYSHSVCPSQDCAVVTVGIYHSIHTWCNWKKVAYLIWINVWTVRVYFRGPEAARSQVGHTCNCQQRVCRLLGCKISANLAQHWALGSTHSLFQLLNCCVYSTKDSPGLKKPVQ